MKYRILLLAALVPALAGCGEPNDTPLAPALLLNAATTDGTTLVGDVSPDVAFVSAVEQLASTCPGDANENYAVLFGHSGCLIVTPDGSSYSLTDDVILGTTVKRGQITAIQVRGQDVIGADGIKHESDVIKLPVPVTPDPNGFVLHVHADNVPVWRLSGHLKGRRVEMIGTIAVGDIIYRKP